MSYSTQKELSAEARCRPMAGASKCSLSGELVDAHQVARGLAEGAALSVIGSNLPWRVARFIGGYQWRSAPLLPLPRVRQLQQPCDLLLDERIRIGSCHHLLMPDTVQRSMPGRPWLPRMSEISPHVKVRHVCPISRDA